MYKEEQGRRRKWLTIVLLAQSVSITKETVADSSWELEAPWSTASEPMDVYRFTLMIYIADNWFPRLLPLCGRTVHCETGTGGGQFHLAVIYLPIYFVSFLLWIEITGIISPNQPELWSLNPRKMSFYAMEVWNEGGVRGRQNTYKKRWRIRTTPHATHLGCMDLYSEFISIHVARSTRNLSLLALELQLKYGANHNPNPHHRFHCPRPLAAGYWLPTASASDVWFYQQCNAMTHTVTVVGMYACITKGREWDDASHDWYL